MATGKLENKRGIWALLAGMAVVLTACAQPETPPEPQPVEIHYVALGDSYAAMGSRDVSTTGPEFCLRATDNYPALVGMDQRITTATDASCQGAQIPDLTESRNTGSSEIPAQLGALETGTNLVTLSIGGNDLGFGEIVGCIQENLFSGAQVNCVAELGGAVRERLAELPAELDDVYNRIDDYSGGARVITTGYLPILTDSQECPELAALPATDRVWAAQLTAELNGVLANAAEKNGADFVLPAGVEEHTVCAEPDQRWVDITGAETGSHPMHPTESGQAAMAEAVLDQL